MALRTAHALGLPRLACWAGELQRCGGSIWKAQPCLPGPRAWFLWLPSLTKLPALPQQHWPLLLPVAPLKSGCSLFHLGY